MSKLCVGLIIKWTAVFERDKLRYLLRIWSGFFLKFGSGCGWPIQISTWRKAARWDKEVSESGCKQKVGRVKYTDVKIWKWADWGEEKKLGKKQKMRCEKLNSRLQATFDIIHKVQHHYCHQGDCKTNQRALSMLFQSVKQDFALWNRQYWLQIQAQKNTSKTRYPLESKMAPAVMEMTASPRFWMDCMLVDKQRRNSIKTTNP